MLLVWSSKVLSHRTLATVPVETWGLPLCVHSEASEPLQQILPHCLGSTLACMYV